MSETGTERVCEQCGRAFTAGKSWSKFCSSGCKVRAFRARNRSESDLERLLSAALDAVRRGITEGPALSALRRALVVAPQPEEQIPSPAPVVAEQPAKVKSPPRSTPAAEQPAPKVAKPAKVKPAPAVADPIAEQPAPTKQPALFGEELAAVADKAGGLSERTRLRALCETIDARASTPCCEMAQFAELETGDEESDEHRSYWQVRDRSNGTIALLYRRELAELLDSARSAIPSLLDDSERLAEAEARATRAEAMLRTIADILLAETGTDGPTSPEHAARLAAAEIGVLRRERDTLRGICEELHVDDARDAVEAIYKLKDAIDDASNARVRALAAERDALRAIIAGRETPPTDAEIAAHFAAGGWWRSFRHAYESEHNGRPFTVSAVTREYGSDHFMIVDRMEHTRDGLTTTWWAMRDGRPCAWPVVP